MSTYKIVILDGYTANPGDIDWSQWHSLTTPQGENIETVIYDRTAPDETLLRTQDADIVLTNKVIIDGKLMAQLPRLRYIGVLATGYNVVDVTEAHRRGIVVTNIPAYSTNSVAQMVMAHLLHITQHVGDHSRAVTEGRWTSSKDFCFWDFPLIELSGQTMCIVGLGNTGKATARIALNMGMKVKAWSSKSQEQLAQMGIEKAESLEQLFREADVLSLHCPLTAETHHLVCLERLALMKPSAILINTGRGPLVNEQDLADALNEGRLYAAGLDVLEQEPPRQGSPLITAHNCFITPHIAWATLQARQRLMQTALQNVKAFLAGKPENEV